MTAPARARKVKPAKSAAVLEIKFTAAEIVLRPIDELIPFPNNPKVHTPEQIAAIAANILEFGFDQPILIDEKDTILKGHGRQLAGRKAGLTHVPTIARKGLTAAQKWAIVISDNALPAMTGFDNSLLRIGLTTLAKLDYDLKLTGFDDVRLATFGIGPSAPPADPDEEIEPEKIAISRSGDIWLMGDHRVVCGDATDAGVIAKLTDGELADLLFTSPPYAEQRDYGKTKKAGNWDAMMQGVFQSAPMKPAGQVLVNLGIVHRDGEWMPYWESWIEWMRSKDWRRFGWYVWDQGPGLPGDWNGRLAPSHEFVFHFNKQAAKTRKTKDSKGAGQLNHGGGLRTPGGAVLPKSGAGVAIQEKKISDSVVRIMRHKARGIEVEHPAVFPVALPTEFINAYSDPGMKVYEPFAGSGSTVVSAEMTGRACLACEINPIYVDICVRRWQKITGKKATLQGSKRTFDQIEKDRSKAAA